LTKNRNHPPGLPSKEEIRKYLHDHPGPLNKREIARVFGIKGQDRTQLRILLRAMTEEGAVKKTSGKAFQAADVLPPTVMIEITDIDIDGEVRARPVEFGWEGPGETPAIFVLGGKSVKPGDRMLAKLVRTEKNEYEARILKTLDAVVEGRVVGTFKSVKGGGVVYPTDKKVKEDYFIPAEHAGDVQDGDLVMAEMLPASQKYPRSKNAARIAQRLGRKDDPRLISLIAIHSHSIPTEFSPAALKEAEKMTEPEVGGKRVDIRHLPLVTIDGADARDFDDAVFAEPDDNPKNSGGWHLIVAIADVSHYVTTGSALDKTAFDRGNSTYFADRVVPMLPEKLSNDLCSLRPKVNRACLAVHMWIDKDARLVDYKFFRGLMRSAARLTYEQVEEAHKGSPDDTTGPLLKPVIEPLFKAYSKLKHARELRGALEIDLPERKAIINDKGQVTAIVPRARLQSHQLVEEFMILANVAAALALKDKPCLYRIHPPPAYDKLESTREFLKEFGYSLPKADQIQPKNINHLLKLSAEKPDKELIHTVLLRTQSQATYSPENIGHFGLALKDYAHFTSPIRRYADLIVHRSLVKAYNLGDGGLSAGEADNLHEVGEHISATERRSMLAERDVMDRFTAQYLSANVGKEFKGRISGVTHFGLFVSLDETGADGLVPMRSLPGDYYIHDEKRHALVGKNSGRTYRLAEPVVIRLKEADPLRGSTVFEMLDGARGGDEGFMRRGGGKGRGGGERHGGGDRRGKRPGGKSRRGGGKGRGRR
jgi:ribonuclease R